MSKQDISTDTLKRLLSQTTPGPWEKVKDFFRDGHHRRKAVGDWVDHHTPRDQLWIVEAPDESSVLVGGENTAHLISLAPALAQEVVRLRELVRQGLKFLDADQCNCEKNYKCITCLMMEATND